MGGCAPGPRPRSGVRRREPPGPLSLALRLAQSGSARPGLWPVFCALRVRRSPRCAALAWLRPLRRGAPARGFAVRAPAVPALRAFRPPARPGLGPCPPAPPLGLLCAAARLRGRSLAPSAFAGPSAPSAGSLFGRPCSAPGRLRAARGPAGSPRGPPPLRGLRARWAPAPGPCAALWAACLPFGPRGLWLRARACAGLLGASVAAFAVAAALSPAPLPSPPPPLGAPGKREAC